MLQNENDPTIFGQYRVVATVEKFYSILERIHSTENGHVGYKKTLAKVSWMYLCVRVQLTYTLTFVIVGPEDIHV